MKHAIRRRRDATHALVGVGLGCALSTAILPCAARYEGPPASGQTGAGLCKVGERALYNCPTTNNKFVSICTVGDKGVQYRFGTMAHVEMAFPADPQEGPKRLLWSHYSRPLVERWTVKFSTEDAEYYIRDWWDEENVRKTGVAVFLIASGRELTIPCRGDPTMRREDMARMLTCDKESALGMGCK